jgi:hypothetical protein
MATVPIDKNILTDLIVFKLRRIQGFIQDILNRWHETDSAIFLQKARDGTFEDAENDAIELRQLLLEEQKLYQLQETI